LNISYTQLNIIGLAGNGKLFFAYTRLYFDVFFCSVGVSASAPIWGRMVDSRGPRILYLLSFVFLLGGYSGIKHLYDSGPPPGTSALPALSFYILVLCSFMTGCGSFGGVTSTLNSTVKSFPDEVVSE
jgi:MFS family permease